MREIGSIETPPAGRLGYTHHITCPPLKGGAPEGGGGTQGGSPPCNRSERDEGGACEAGGGCHDDPSWGGRRILPLALLFLLAAVAGGCDLFVSDFRLARDAGDATDVAGDGLDARDAGEDEGAAEDPADTDFADPTPDEAATDEGVVVEDEDDAEPPVEEIVEIISEPESPDVVEEEERLEVVVEPDAADTAAEDGASVTAGFVFIPAGSFSMGSPIGEPGQSTNEAQHTVTLTVSFEMMAREVTQGDFLARVGRNPSYFPSCGATCPVEQVSWHEALDYANLFSAYMGKAQCFDCTGSGTAGVTCSLKTAYARPQDCPGYRLPTEAEWEYAARATTTSAYHDGGASDSGHLHCETPFHLTDIAWYCGNASSTTHAVGGKTANPWGLFDMSGNVWEWVWDWHRADYEALSATDPVNMTAGSNRVVRGGSWYYYAHYCRSAYRSNNSPGIRSGALGLRLARSW